MTAGGSTAAAVLLDRAAKVLEEFVWHERPTVSDGAVVVAYAGDEGSWALIAGVPPDDEVLVVYSALAEPIPDVALPAVIEFLSRVNDGLPRGNLEIDFAKQLVRCRTSLDVEGLDVADLERAGVLDQMIRTIVLANVATMDMVLPGLRDVVSGAVTPKEADAQMAATDE